MNRLAYLLFFGLLACQQPQKPVTPSSSLPIKKESKPHINSGLSIPLSIAEIKAAYAETVEKLENKTLDSTSITYNCQQERSGTITYFTNKGKIVLIKHIYSEYSHYSATDQYFVTNNVLYFAYLNGVSWSFESGAAGQEATQDNITERRLYLLKGKPALSLEKKYTMHSKNPDTTLAARTPSKTVVLKTAQPLLRAFKRLVDFKNSTEKGCLEK